MWRGFFVSCRYSVTCWSESLRPNQVFHQNRKGIRQISHAVRKKRSFWVRDMPGLRAGASLAGTGLGDMLSIDDIGVQDSLLFQIVRHRVFSQDRGLDADFGADPFAFGVGRARWMFG